MIRSDDFREFPIIPDRGEGYSNNIYSWFKYWFRQYDNEMAPEMLLRLAENKTEELTKQFSNKVDEEATEVFSCKICLVNALKVVFTSCGHTACSSCADKFKDCHICRKTISKKIKIFL